MKEFNLDQALAGDPVVYKDFDGIYPARIICFDRQYKGRPILALVMVGEDNEIAYPFDQKGISPIGHFLLMAPVKKQEWCNIYLRGHTSNGYSIGVDVYPSEADAKTAGTPLKDYVTSVLIREWEE